MKNDTKLVRIYKGLHKPVRPVSRDYYIPAGDARWVVKDKPKKVR